MPDTDTDDGEPAVTLKKEIGLLSACGLIVGKSVFHALRFLFICTLYGRKTHAVDKSRHIVCVIP